MKFLIAASASLLILCCLSIENARADCTLTAVEPMPLQVVEFGSKYIYSYPTRLGSYTAATNEKINLFCSQGFLWNENYNLDQLEIELTCMSNGFRGKTTEDYTYNYGQLNMLTCKGLAANHIYESKSSLPHCEDAMTLVVGHDLGRFGQMKTVSLCYDINKPELKYVSYVAYPIRNRALEKSALGDLESLGLDVGVTYRKQIFKPANGDEASQEWSQSHEFKQLFADATFEYLSIIQEEDFDIELNNYSDMFSIAWLHALRVGNWRHFLNAMKAATTKGQGSIFQVHVGVSGVIEVPLYQECNVTRILTIKTPSNGWATVPAHIWAHIRPLPSKKNQQSEAAMESNEFVFIAHNSPFYRNNDASTLCKSMCHEISWLKNSLFGKLQNYFLYGLVECCRVTDVAHKLDNFPQTAQAPSNEKEVENAPATVAQEETVETVSHDETVEQKETVAELDYN